MLVEALSEFVKDNLRVLVETERLGFEPWRLIFWPQDHNQRLGNTAAVHATLRTADLSFDQLAAQNFAGLVVNTGHSRQLVNFDALQMLEGIHDLRPA